MSDDLVLQVAEEGKAPDLFRGVDSIPYVISSTWEPPEITRNKLHLRRVTDDSPLLGNAFSLCGRVIDFDVNINVGAWRSDDDHHEGMWCHACERKAIAEMALWSKEAAMNEAVGKLGST